MIHYRGQRRDGTAITGVVDEPAPVLAQRLYGMLWQWAELVRDDEVVGAVLVNDAGKRTWWAES